MPEARLVTGFWVAAYRKRLELMDIPVFVVARGDDTAGSVLVKLATLDGQACLYEQRYDLMSGERRWEERAKGDEAEVDATISRARATDPDLWVLEVEDRAGRHCLDQM